MARLNRPSLSFIGLLVALGIASNAGCGFETHGVPPDDTPTGGKGGMGGAGGEGGMVGPGGMGGTGGGMVCKPGTKKSCYTGDPKTGNIGNCTPGSQSCLADGTGYEDMCVGEVVPTLEDCATVGDEDCDGLSDVEDSECKCVPGQIFPCETGMQGVCAMGMGLCSADGKSFDSCVQEKQPSPENCVTPEDDNCDGMAAPLCTGTPTWSYTPTGASATPNDDAIFSVAYAPDGGYVIAGIVDADLGADGFIPEPMNQVGKAYVAKFDANKALEWEKKFDTTVFSVVRGVAVDKDKNVIITGSFSGNMTIESATLVSDGVDMFLIKLNPAGAVIWAKPMQFPKTQNALGVAVDSAANIYITGGTDNAIDFDGSMSPMPNNVDVFVASLKADGVYNWGKLYVNNGAQIGRGIVTTADDEVVIVGDTGDATDLGGGPIPKGNNLDIFVARYHKDGSHYWSQLYGKAMDQVGRGVGMAPDGNVLITGGFTGTIDWKTGTSITNVGTSDVYVAKLNGTTGTYMMHAQGGKTGTSVGSSVGADAAGNITVFGHFNGSIDFGSQSVASSPSSYDTFLVKLKGADWTPVYTKPYGKLGNQFGWDVAVAADGTTLVGGGFNQEFEVPPNAIVPTTGGMDLFGVLAN